MVRLTQIASLTAVLLLAAVGCSNSEHSNLAAVTGVVTLDGAPYPNAHVMFSPAQGRPSEGVTDATGKYTLNYLPGVKGAEPGTHTVSITTQHESPENPGSEPPFVEPLPPKYNAQTTLTATVAKGPNTVDFPMTSK